MFSSFYYQFSSYDTNVAYLLVAEMVETVANILKLSPTHFVAIIDVTKLILGTWFGSKYDTAVGDYILDHNNTKVHINLTILSHRNSLKRVSL